MSEERIQITDDFMFGYVMRQGGICASVLECLLPGIHISKVQFKNEPEPTAADTQKTIQGNMNTHSVRLDVYLDDGTTVFNVEMQTGNKQNLPKRVRYYGGRIDCDQLERTQDYNRLRPTYVIFICTFDPFGEGLYHYTFENRCAEEPDLKLGDESYKVFFNAAGTKGEISDELKALLDYFRNPAEFPAAEETPLINRIDSLVDYANHDSDWRMQHMTFAQARLDAIAEGRMEGRALGMAEGRAKGKAEGEVTGRIKTLVSLARQKMIPLQYAAAEAHMTEQEFSALVEAAE